MKIIIIFAVINCLVLIQCGNVNHQRDDLWKEFSAKGGTDALKGVLEWREKKKIDFQKMIHGLTDNLKKEIIQRADKENMKDWESLRVSQYLEYVNIGQRVNFEKSEWHRRDRLGVLVLGELITAKGKYIDQIANGLWLTLEESTWESPGDLHMQKAGAGLPDPDEPIVDLRTNINAADISLIRLLLNDQISKYAPNNMFIKRIDYELNRRIVRPYLDDDSMWWTGHGRYNNSPVNNHNTWNHVNILLTTLTAIDNVTLRNEMIERIVHGLDVWLNFVPDDGGCDEGTNYWVEAGGNFIRIVHILSEVSNGTMSWSSNDLIKKIGDYIYKIHIDGDRFINFGDALPRLVPNPTRILKFGELFNDTKMIEFAAYLNAIDNDMQLMNELTNLWLFFDRLEANTTLKSTKGLAPQLSEAWLPELQVLTLRSKEGSSDGLFIGAKGGYNDESHNHNDVGSFVLYIDGKPALIDVGTGVYTNETFSKNRYNIWSMQSQWHNLPTINGLMQKDGRQYKANNITFTKNNDCDVLQMDIAAAYPNDAAIKKWIRKFVFNRTADTLQITENYDLTEMKAPFVLHFITILHDADQSNAGKIILKGNGTSLMMEYDDKVFGVNFDQMSVHNDPTLSHWGDNITRLNMTSKTTKLSGEFTIVFHKH